MGIGYHLRQSLIAVGSGGIKGLGFGLSRQRFGFLPETMSDSVFAIFAEELGFIGGVLLILLFIIFLVNGFKIANNCNDKFLRYTAFGIVSWITIQAFVNIGAMISLVPLTGIPLPFISYGGSAIISEFIGLGILLNISKRSKI
jgi:cell division protein FtsW